MKPLDIYNSIRARRKDRLTLRLRLTLLVSGELIGSVLLALAVYFIFLERLPLDGKLLLVLDLVVITTIIGVAVTHVVARYFFDPVKKLRKGMAQVSDGDFSVRLADHSSSYEIMELYAGFNLMASQLEATEILQSDFVSNVSHEFKTPINAIEGYSMLLQNGENLKPEQQEYLQKILFNTQRLSTLVGSVLLLSKIENQSIPTGRAQYRLDEQIRQSIVALEPAWEKKNTEFDVELEEILFCGNEPMMRHVWDNLIGNAIKFGPENGVVALRLQRKGEKILFSVEDEGPGLTAEAQKHIFDKFYQADNSHRQEGNGLGLALVKKILDLCEAQITAENTGKGCRFTVTLAAKE